MRGERRTRACHAAEASSPPTCAIPPPLLDRSNAGREDLLLCAVALFRCVLIPEGRPPCSHTRCPGCSSRSPSREGRGGDTRNSFGTPSSSRPCTIHMRRLVL